MVIVSPELSFQDKFCIDLNQSNMDSPQLSTRSNSSSPIKILKSDSTFAKSFGSKE